MPKTKLCVAKVGTRSVVEGKLYYTATHGIQHSTVIWQMFLFAVFGRVWKRLFISSTNMHTKWKTCKRTNLLEPTETTGYTYDSL